MTASQTRRIGMAQMWVEAGDPEANIARAVEFIARAAAAECAAVVLPECLDLGWTDPSAAELAQPIPGPRTERLGAAAREHDIYVAAGLVERDGDVLYNASVLIDPTGAVILRHRKIMEVGDGIRQYDLGTALEVVKTPLGVIGIPICADNLEPSLAVGSALALMGAELVLSPSAWAVSPDYDHERRPYGMEWAHSYGRLAREHGLATVGVSYVGQLRGDGDWSGWPVIGRSLAMDANGDVVAWGDFGSGAEQLLVAEVAVRSREPADPVYSVRGWTRPK